MGVDLRARLTEQLISARLFGVIVRVEQRAYRCAVEARSHRLGERRGTAVDEEDAIGRGQRDDVSGRAGDERYPVGKLFGSQRSLVGSGRPLPGEPLSGGRLLATRQAAQ